MNRLRAPCWLLLAGLLALASARAAEPLPPKPARYVTDNAGILSPQTAAAQCY